MDQQAIIDAINSELARRKMSRDQLADATGLSPTTINKSLSTGPGARPMQPATIVRIEEALQIDLRDAVRPIAVAAERLGSYSQPQYGWLASSYLAVRKARRVHGALFAQHMEIEWDEREHCLMFRIADFPGAPYVKFGSVSIPSLGTQIQLLAEEMGGHELINLQRPDATKILRGIHLTTDDDGGLYRPVARKVAFAPLAVLRHWEQNDYGTITPDHARFDECQNVLEPRRPDSILE